ncbi:MAG: hypothetical protein PHU25_06075 [Deltaproteobacteria bacterium]|nr:hypothetical protein [Deltaproteobacteria bacterium]
MNVKEAIVREVDALPEKAQADVLAFVRFLKIGLGDMRELERRFSSAVRAARLIASQQGIGEAEVASEIRAARSGG